MRGWDRSVIKNVYKSHLSFSKYYNLLKNIGNMKGQ